MIIRLLARSLAQRLYERKFPGITPYYTDGFASRLQAAEWQIQRCAHEVILEIGCGRDMHTALIAALKYHKKVLAFDVAPLANLELINFTAAQLGHAHEFTSISALEAIGITYIVAPEIAHLQGFKDLVSTAVFEHIPPAQLAGIFACASRNQVESITANIDFKDHWSYIENVGPDNFYYLPEFLWRCVNNRRMYQNRLRFSDINQMAEANGFKIAELNSTMDADLVIKGHVNNHFKNHSTDDLRTMQVSVHWKNIGA